MYKLLTVVFSDEKTAYEGAHALRELNDEASIAVYAAAVICHNTDGTVSTRKVDEDLPLQTFAGTAIGALIGLLGGAAGVAVGGAMGAFGGMFGDLHNADVDTQFLDDVSASLGPGKCAVVAEIDEDWVTPVDTRMEALGGVVHRTPKSSVEHDQWSRVVADARAELKQLKAEEAQATADRRAKLHAQVDRLSKRLDAKEDSAKAHHERVRREFEAKVAALQDSADKQKGEAKAAIDARIARLRQDYDRRVQAQVEAYGTVV
jgi:uncharacterized membrane protein